MQNRKGRSRSWTALIQSIAAGDEAALHALYDMAHRIVFTLIMRISANRETADRMAILHPITHCDLPGMGRMPLGMLRKTLARSLPNELSTVPTHPLQHIHSEPA